MADVEMTDAAAAPKVKSSKGGPSAAATDGKKRFELKKVSKTSGSIKTSADEDA